MLRSKRSDSHPVMLGPTLIHKHKDEEAFGYLASCLVRSRPNLSYIIAVGSDRDKAIKNGFQKHLPRAVVITCKKHFEDDMKRKLTELGINGQERQDILTDIFGSEITQELGLLDRNSEAEFDNDLKNLKPIWDNRERKARDSNSPLFHSWFLKYHSKDAKEMLLYPVRRDLGFGYNFYYNNDTESVHRNIKSRQDYRASDMPTVIDNIRKEKDTNLSYVEDSLVGNGPYKLDHRYDKFKVNHHAWTYDMSDKQKKTHLANFHRAAVTSNQTHSSATVTRKEEENSSNISSNAVEQNATLTVPFENTGLSSAFKAAYVKAAELRKNVRSIVEAPVGHGGYMVASKSEPQPHFVVVKKDGAVKCPCKGFKTGSLCAHSLAVADHTEQLEDYLVWFHKNGGVNITNAASSTAPKNTGRKPCQSKRERKRKTPSDRNKDNTFSDKRPLSTEPDIFNLRWLADCKAQACYGCGGKFRPNSSGVPDPPFDVVLTTMEFRSWYDKESRSLKVTKQPDRTHYHLSNACVWQKNPEFDALSNLEIRTQDSSRCSDLHKQHILNTLGLAIP